MSNTRAYITSQKDKNYYQAGVTASQVLNHMRPTFFPEIKRSGTHIEQQNTPLIELLGMQVDKKNHMLEQKLVYCNSTVTF